MYWNALFFIYGRLFPELELFPTDKLRRRAFRKALSSACMNPYALAITIGGCIIAIWVSVFLKRVVSLEPMVVFALVMLVIGAFGSCSIVLVRANRVRQMLRTELRSCGIYLCLNCGYQLRGKSSDVCPECGTASENT